VAKRRPVGQRGSAVARVKRGLGKCLRLAAQPAQGNQLVLFNRRCVCLRQDNRNSAGFPAFLETPLGTLREPPIASRHLQHDLPGFWSFHGLGDGSGFLGALVPVGRVIAIMHVRLTSAVCRPTARLAVSSQNRVACGRPAAPYYRRRQPSASHVRVTDRVRQADRRYCNSRKASPNTCASVGWVEHPRNPSLLAWPIPSSLACTAQFSGRT
jgi:hypothetical protein